MSERLDLFHLAQALARHPLFQEGPPRLDILSTKGLAHDHIAILGKEIDGLPLLMRLPKQSQFALSAHENLTYQSACFTRVGEAGQAPRLFASLPPDKMLPMGALIVEWIKGRVPELPRDLPALALCMARVHALPLPPMEARAPLANHEDPVGGAMAEIRAQAEFLTEAGLSPEAAAEIGAELAWAEGFAEEIAGKPQVVTLVLTDTHPGNFLIEESGRAVIVDLEKALYGSPGTDLAHATIYSSTTWDPDCHAVLSVADVADFYRCYLEGLRDAGREDLVQDLRPWLIPLRRITMLRAITWCAKWQVMHQRELREAKHLANSTEDWSAEINDPAIVAHVANRVSHYLSAEVLRRMRAEWLSPDGLGVRI
jgi:aminoglycoside phosphotransferase (APT) family kinase protein